MKKLILYMMIATMLSGCVSLPKVERYVDDNGKMYNLETIDYRTTKEWGMVATWTLTMYMLYLQAENN